MDRISQEYIYAVLKYLKSDVEELLKIELKVAGPFLAVISNGIDVLGGFYYGFHDNKKSNSAKRSFNFMKEKMGINELISALLYKDVRCGIVHHGIPKNSVAIFADYERKLKGEFIYKDEDHIYINVVELAYLYLKTIDSVYNDLSNGITLPISSTTDITITRYHIDDIKEIVTKSILEYWVKKWEGFSYAPFSIEEIPIVKDSPHKS